MTPEKRRCACSRYIEAEPEPKAIEHAVRTHQRQPEHRAWWQQVSLEAEKTTGPNVRLGPSSPFYVTPAVRRVA